MVVDIIINIMQVLTMKQGEEQIEKKIASVTGQKRKHQEGENDSEYSNEQDCCLKDIQIMKQIVWDSIDQDNEQANQSNKYGIPRKEDFIHKSNHIKRMDFNSNIIFENEISMQ